MICLRFKAGLELVLMQAAQRNRSLNSINLIDDTKLSTGKCNSFFLGTQLYQDSGKCHFIFMYQSGIMNPLTAS